MYVINQLNKLSSITERFIKLIRQHPERFTSLSFSQKYSNFFLKEDQDSQVEKFILDSYPEKNYLVFSSLIVQIAGIHQQAFIHKNLRLIFETIIFVIYSLRDISIQSKQEGVIEYFLDTLYIKEFDCDGEKALEHFKTVEIYFIIVFQDNFKLEYLSRFDRYLFEQFKYIVDDNRAESIDYFSSSATTDSKVIPPKRYSRLSGYDDFTSTNRRSLENLITKLENIYLVSEINECCTEFNKLAELDNNKQEILQTQENFNRSVVRYYKYNHLKDLVFALGAYCVYKKNFGLIYKLWEYNQPEDSTATIINPAIVPTGYGELLNFYFSAKLDYRVSAIYWDHNHGKKRYYHLYLILSLVRTFSTPIAIKADITKAQLHWNLFDSSYISYIKREIEVILENFIFLEKYEQYFVYLNLSIAQVNWIIINKVKPLFRHLSKQIVLKTDDKK